MADWEGFFLWHSYRPRFGFSGWWIDDGVCCLHSWSDGVSLKIIWLGGGCRLKKLWVDGRDGRGKKVIGNLCTQNVQPIST